MADQRLAGRVALVTGGGDGIGRATAVRLAEDGAAVGIATIDPQQAKDAVAECESKGVKAACSVADLGVLDDVRRAHAELVEALGPVDILVNNVGIAIEAPFLESTDEEFDRTFAVNFMAAVRLTRLSLPAMLEAGWGSVINVASAQGIFGWSNFAAYSSAKGALTSPDPAARERVQPARRPVQQRRPGLGPHADERGPDRQGRPGAPRVVDQPAHHQAAPEAVGGGRGDRVPRLGRRVVRHRQHDGRRRRRPREGPLTAVSTAAPDDPAIGPDPGGALGHLRILDFTALVQGPLATQILGDLGADVIKFERLDGEWSRHWGIGNGRTHGEIDSFLAFNRNKRSVAADLKDPGTRERILALAETADVVVENFRPGVMDRLGLGYADFAARTRRSSMPARRAGVRPGRTRRDRARTCSRRPPAASTSSRARATCHRRRSGSGSRTCSRASTSSLAILAAVTHRQQTGRGPARRGRPVLVRHRAPAAGAHVLPQPRQHPGATRRGTSGRSS